MKYKYTRRKHKYGGDKSKIKKYNSDLCNNDMNFQDCELAILRHAIDESEKAVKLQIVNSPEVSRMISILEKFLKEKQLIVYGGTAVNNILPKKVQFYDRSIEVPDYDFYSSNALDDALELADIYHKAGYQEVEAKSGVHYGTFKVFVNFIPIADITYLDKIIFDAIKEEVIEVDKIFYTPPNFLRMNMYLELSRPMGDVSRWEKVSKRLTLLNEYYPLNDIDGCSKVEFLRRMQVGNDSEKIHIIVRDTFIEEGAIFFGGYATSLYTQYMPENQRKLISKIPDFDVLCVDPEKLADIIMNTLEKSGIQNISIIEHDSIGEIIPIHYEILVEKETIAFIYGTIACHSFNTIELEKNKINVATIDTILTFYFAFWYINEEFYHRDRLMCMIQFLFAVEEDNKLEQKGLLKRFSITCLGKQPTLTDIRQEKTEKFKELKDKKGTKEYNMWFLKYNPGEEQLNIMKDYKYKKKKQKHYQNTKKNYRKPTYHMTQNKNQYKELPYYNNKSRKFKTKQMINKRKEHHYKKSIGILSEIFNNI